MKLNMGFYSSESIYYAIVLNYFTVYGMKHFNYKLQVMIQILRKKNYLEIFWLLWNSHHDSDKKATISVIHYEYSLKTAKLPILTNSPRHEHNMTLNFLSILSTVCSS